MKIRSASQIFQLVLGMALTVQSGVIRLTLSEVRPQAGTVYVALFSGPEGFPDGTQRIRSLPINPPAAQIDTVFSDLPPGDYAIAVFQDLNHNGKPDRNFFGKPKEPVGFSRNLRPKLGPPKFKGAAFSVANDTARVNIQMVVL